MSSISGPSPLRHTDAGHEAWLRAIDDEYAREAAGAPYLRQERALFAERNRFSFYSGTNHLWLMDHAERAGLVMLLELIRPRVCVEIGARYAGATLMFSRYADRVYVIDIDEGMPARCAALPNVEVRVGDSKRLIPALLAELHARGENADLVLVDGDHSTAAVQADLDAVLQRRPLRDSWVVMHDSFNPGCRRGILGAAWQQPWVHAVEVDFTIGNLMSAPHVYRQMWGGLALAELRPHDREGPLTVYETARETFAACERVARKSRHRPALWRRVVGAVRRGLTAASRPTA